MAARDAFSAEEKAAMREHAREAKANATREAAAANLREKIEALEGLDREVAQRLDAIVSEHAPHLEPKTYYGMPGWAKDGKVIVFFQPASKFNVRYGTLGVQENAIIDEGDMWATSWAITALTPEVEERMIALVQRLV